MNRRTLRMQSVFLVAIVLPWLAQACEVLVVFPSVPLPPLPAARPVEDFLPARDGPPKLALPVITSFGHWCGAVGVGFGMHDIAVLGLIELFGSAANFETALAARRVEVTELRPRADPFTAAVERSPAIRISTADAARLRGWLTSDASYLWDGDFELPPLSSGVRVRFYHAGKVVTIDVHREEGVAVVTRSDEAAMTRLAPIPSDIEEVIGSMLPWAWDGSRLR